MDLETIVLNHRGKFSDKWKSYLREYERVLSPMREENIFVLEIGVQNGGSLEIWSQYFANARRIVGCDIDENIGRLRFKDKKIKLVTGDCNSGEVEKEILKQCKEFDLVVDDGSHTAGDIIKSFIRYFRLLKAGGTYVVEDLHCSYWKEYGGGLYHPYSSIAFFKRLVDVINQEHWGTNKRVNQFLDNIGVKFDLQLAEDELLKIHSIEFINSMCVIRKEKKVGDSLLGSRVISGREGLVVPHEKILGSPMLISQIDNSWSNLDNSPEESFEDNLKKITQLESRVKRLSDVAFSDEIERTRLSENLQLRESHISDLNERIAKQDVEIVDLRKKLPELDAQIDHLNSVVTTKELNIENLTESLSWANARIVAIEKSRSWMLTAPLRKISFRSITGIKNLRVLAIKSTRRLLTFALSRIDHTRWLTLYRRYLKGTTLGYWLVDKVSRLLPGLSSEMRLRELLPNKNIVNYESSLTEGYFGSDIPNFDLSPPVNFQLSSDLLEKSCINILLPSLLTKDMSGGPNTALILAAKLSEEGEFVRLIASEIPRVGESVSALYAHIEALISRPINKDKFSVVDATSRSKAVFIGKNDVFFATAWWTAQHVKHALRLTDIQSFIYLIQDYEPLLHQASTFQAKCLETYDFQYIPVVNSKLLLDYFVSQRVGNFASNKFANDSLWFDPVIDPGYFFPEGITDTGSKKRKLLFYARPSKGVRNLYEIAVVSLRHAVASGCITEETWDVCAIGEDLQPVPLGNGVVLKSYPWMGFEEYASQMRKADLLLSLMFSPHPSYPPLEMAASGNVVITNSYCSKTQSRLAEISPNIVAVKPTVESVSLAIKTTVNRINLGLGSYRPSGDINLPSNWDDALHEAIDGLRNRINSLRSGSRYAMCSVTNANSPYSEDAPRFERTPKTKISSEESLPQSTLLTFITCAYDTDPDFLRTLAKSVLDQYRPCDFDWLILDNGSIREDTRETLKEISSHPAVTVKRVKCNLGIIGGMRFCLDRASGRYVIPLDSDDRIHRDCVKVLTRFIRKHNFPPILYSDEDKVAGEQVFSPYHKPDWDPVLFAHSCYIAHLCAIDRLKAIELDLYSDTAVEGCHDWDSFIRFMNAGYKPQHVPEVLYNWRAHGGSTSLNITSKNYITNSHKSALQNFLNYKDVDNISLGLSPFFKAEVDWCFQRERVNPQSIETITIWEDREDVQLTEKPGLNFFSSCKVSEIAELVSSCKSDLIYLRWNDVEPIYDEWSWDAMALFELFPDTVVVGGVLTTVDGTILDGPAVFGFGDGFDCPEAGRSINEPGYFARMWKPHSVSAVPAAHCLISTKFITQFLDDLSRSLVTLRSIGPWLGALAFEDNSRVVYSPYMHARTNAQSVRAIDSNEKAIFLTQFFHLMPDNRFYSRKFSLEVGKGHSLVEPEDNLSHLRTLQRHLPSYERLFEAHLHRRSRNYPVPDHPKSITVITTVYEGTNLLLLDRLAQSLLQQTLGFSEWVIVAHGPIKSADICQLREKAGNIWQALLFVIEKPLGIIGAMQFALECAKSDYILPVDADDLLTEDALQVMVSSIDKLQSPDLIFSDEDLLTPNGLNTPYLRSTFDPILNLESSYIWHLCAINRKRALNLSLYSDRNSEWCHDWDTVMRIANAGGSIEHVPEVLYHWRQHEQSTTNKPQGDARSLDSVRNVLNAQIATLEHSNNFFIADWPLNRGSRELYIARKGSDMPTFISPGDVVGDIDQKNQGKELVLVLSRFGVHIDSQEVYVEVARLMGLHPLVGAVGGIVINNNKIIVDGCSLVNGDGILERPWNGAAMDDPGPFALKLKPQSVTATGNALAFFRVSALEDVGVFDISSEFDTSHHILTWCDLLAEKKWKIAFSPLVVGKAYHALEDSGAASWFTSALISEGFPLTRYSRTIIS